MKQACSSCYSHQSPVCPRVCPPPRMGTLVLFGLPPRNESYSGSPQLSLLVVVDEIRHHGVCGCLPENARDKSSSQRPQGLLLPLFVPHRRWSHFSLDFITGLPKLPFFLNSFILLHYPHPKKLRKSCFIMFLLTQHSFRSNV